MHLDLSFWLPSTPSGMTNNNDDKTFSLYKLYLIALVFVAAKNILFIIQFLELLQVIAFHFQSLTWARYSFWEMALTQDQNIGL